MKILLDECVDWRLSRDLARHDVVPVHRQGWTGIKNGELLRRAAQAFDVSLTVDRNLAIQQSIDGLSIAVIVLCAPTNRLDDLQPLVPDLLQALETAPKGGVTRVGQVMG